MKHSFRIFLALLFGLLLVAESFADDKDGNGKNDKDEKRKLDLKFDSSKAELEVKSETDSGTEKNKFELEVRTDDHGAHPTIRMKYYSKSADSKARYEYRINFENLIEFNNADGTGYDPNGSETVLQTYELGRSGWRGVQSASGDTTLYTFAEKSGAFSFTVHVSGAVYNVEGLTLNPSEIKIDVKITSFNWLGNSDSALALQAKVQTALRTKKSDSSNDDQIVIEDDSGTSAGYFSWANEVTLGDNSTADVTSSSLKATTADDSSSDDNGENMGAQEIFFTFDVSGKPSYIFWDPIIGVGSSGASSLVASALFVLFAAAIAML